MTEPAQFDAKITPSVTIAGKEWPIPKLVPRQQRYIYQELMAMTRVLQLRADETFADKITNLSNDEYEQLLHVVYHGLTRAHGSLSREEFLDWESTPLEILMAFLTVRNQSGLFKIVAEAGDTEGEAIRTDQTGTS